MTSESRVMTKWQYNKSLCSFKTSFHSSEIVTNESSISTKQHTLSLGLHVIHNFEKQIYYTNPQQKKNEAIFFEDPKNVSLYFGEGKEN